MVVFLSAFGFRTCTKRPNSVCVVMLRFQAVILQIMLEPCYRKVMRTEQVIADI